MIKNKTMRTKNRNKEYSKINSLNDITRNKRIIETKLKVRKVLLNRHLKDFNHDFSGDYVFKQSLKALKIENPTFNMIPSLVKGMKINRKVLISLFSGFAATFTSFLVMKTRESDNEKK